MNKTYEEMYKLEDSYSDMASRINETEHIVGDLLAEKIEMVGDIDIKAQFALGCAIYPRDACSYEKLYAIADKRMYQHKELLKGRESLT